MTETTTSIEAKAREIVAEYMNTPESKIDASSHFVRDMGADSLDTVELVLCFEDGFGVELTDDEMEGMKTFGDAVRIIKAHKIAMPVVQ